MHSGYFACEPEFLKSNFAFFFSLEPELTVEDILEIQDSVAKIKIKGALRDHEYDIILQALNTVALNDQIKSLDLLIDSPGGTIEKTDLVWQAINDISKSKKVIAYSMGVMASAAYWIASAANKIVATAPSDILGSIGVMFASLDIDTMMEEDGFKKVVIRASNSSKKNLSPSSEEGHDQIQERLDSLERIMLNRIAEGRNKTVDYIISNYGQGDVFVALDPKRGTNDALKRGLVDKIIGKGFSVNKKSNENMNTRRVTSMKTLEEYFAEDLKLERLVEKAIAQAKMETETKVRNDLKPIANYMKGNYPDSIKALLVRAIEEGGRIIDQAVGSVTTYDAVKASQNIAAAIEASEAIPEIPVVPDGVPPEGEASTDGVIRSEADITNAIADLKTLTGRVN